jgi:hypothetical protein
MLVAPLPLGLFLVASAASGDFQVSTSTAVASASAGGPIAPNASHAIGVSTFGDHAAGVLSFDLFAGRATLTTHACAAPLITGDPAGIASAGALHEQIVFAYQITSATLPVGTPVALTVCVAASRSVSTTYVPPLVAPPIGDQADAGLNLTLTIGGHSFGGSGYDIAYYQAPSDTSIFTGIFLESQDDETVTLQRAVGDFVNLYLNFTCYAHARAIPIGALADGNVSATVLFGAYVAGADAELRSVLDNSLFPGCGTCTAEEAQKQLPPPPPLGPCYEGVCPDGYYCAKDAGDCDGAGVCLPVPSECPDLDEPVCGCDNRTFANACDAAASGVNVAYVGRCGDRQPSDLNGDGLVGGADLAILLGAWGECPLTGGCIEDIAPEPNGDGEVNGADLAVLLGSWSTK